MLEKFLGKIVSNTFPRDLLLTEKIAEWYEQNPYHKFNKGDILIIRDRKILGYGIRAVAVVNDYYKKGKKGEYDIDMYKDTKGNLLQWITKNEIPQGVERILSGHEKHFKFNIENHFKKVKAYYLDEAVDLYKSVEVIQTKAA